MESYYGISCSLLIISCTACPSYKEFWKSNRTETLPFFVVLRKKRLIWANSLKVLSIITRTAAKTENVCSCSDHFLLFVQSTAQLMGPPTFKADLPTSVNLLPPSQECPEACLLGDSRFISSWQSILLSQFFHLDSSFVVGFNVPCILNHSERKSVHIIIYQWINHLKLWDSLRNILIRSLADYNANSFLVLSI